MTVKPLTLLIIFTYLTGTILIGRLLSNRFRSIQEFSVGRRTFGPFMLASAIGATNFSTATIVGKPGLVYDNGIAVVWLAWNAMACVAAAVIFVPIYRQLRYTTMSEVFEDRYNSGTRGLISVIWMISDTLNRFGLTVYAASVILGLMLGVKFQFIVIFMAALVVVITLFGGLSSVVITDTLQFALMWLGLFIASVTLFVHFGGWSGLASPVPSRLVGMVPPISNGSGWPWIIAMTALGFPYFATSQFVMQKGLGAKSVNVGRWGMLFAGFLALPMAFMAVLPGLAAHQLISGHTAHSMNSDLIGPRVFMQIMPAGALGVFFAALLAAGISTADGALVGVSSLFSHDFYEKWKPGRDQSHYLRVTRLVVVLFAVIGTAWAFMVPLFGGVINALLDVVSVTDMPIFVIVCLAIFWRRMNAIAAIGSIVVGTVCGGSVLLLGTGGIQSLAVTTATSTTTSLIAGIILSELFRRKPEEEYRVQKFLEKLTTVGGHTNDSIQ